MTSNTAQWRRLCGDLSSLGTAYLDLFLLHEQESRLTLRGHARALDCLEDLKRRGLVRAAGVSTHYVDVVRACALHPSIDVIHPIYNWRGIGILDGTAEDMREAIEYAREMGKGIYCMKALGGGHLATDLARSLDYVMSCEAVDSVRLGSPVAGTELTWRSRGRPIEDAAVAELAGRKTLHVLTARGVREVCRPVRSGSSQDSGGQGESTLTCVVCGYCASVCPLFCLKVY